MRVAFIFPSIPTRNDREPDFRNLATHKKDWLGQSAEETLAILRERYGRDAAAASVHIMYTYDAQTEVDGLEWFATKPPNFMCGRKWYQGRQWSKRWFRKIVDWKPDVVHWQMNSYAYTFHLAARGFVKRGIPYVYQHHGPHLSKKRIARWVLKYPHYHAAKGIFLTRFHEKQYREGLGLDPNSTLIIPEGFSDKFRKLDRDACRAKTGFEGDPILFWCGGFNPRKDPLCVLEAFDRVAENFPDARFYMAGYGPLDEEVDAFIENRPRLKAQVTRLGYVNNDELPAMENAADIFVMGSHGEGFALASMEAMACGAFPVITTLDGFLEQTKDGEYGLHFEPGDVDGCTACLRQAMGDVEYRERIRSELPDWVRQWTWPNIASRHVEVYKDVLGKT